MKIDGLEKILTTDSTAVDPTTLLNRRMGDVALPLLTAAMMGQERRVTPNAVTPAGPLTILEDIGDGDSTFI